MRCLTDKAESLVMRLITNSDTKEDVYRSLVVRYIQFDQTSDI